MKPESDIVHADLLPSAEGNNASDLAAFRLAVKSGWSIVDALKYFVGSPELRLVILLESISNPEFVQ